MRLATLLCLALAIASIACAAEEETAQTAEPLPLPEAKDTSEDRIKIPVGGARITLDHLGPAIVAEDGTLRRITNWDTLTPAEKQTALRRIAQRNKLRIEVLQKQVKDLEAAAAAGASEHEQQHQSNPLSAASQDRVEAVEVVEAVEAGTHHEEL